MSSVMLAADSTALQEGRPPTTARPGLRAKGGVSMLRRAEGLVAGLLFIAVRVPLYVGVLLFGFLLSLTGVVLYAIRAVGLRLTRPAGATATAALALVSIAGPQRAKADALSDTSLLQQTTLVSSQQTNLYSFDAPGAGTLTVSLKDWQFPVQLQQLTASILSRDQVLGSLDPATSSNWQFQVQVQGSGVFDAFVAAQAGNFAGLQFGAYSMSIDFTPAGSPVPLPPSLDLLLGGMGLLGAVSLLERISRRRNRDVISFA